MQTLTKVLSLDGQCQWTAHFERCLSEAEQLGCKGLDQGQLSALSGRVMSVFGGMGSFNDYAPFRSGRLIRGMESLDAISGQVYASALSLRVTGART
ncbi:DUF6966 domain-containing protein [Pseudoxanthomonas composti]|uniref:DUF6966 domain-containing protein n=1 Tax=Pseudoxanthomonas composti TaxID=2137479 RepID=A0A4Q1JXH4_9GAMM|nr:hypothetical protein [Pseudoxanthomonas composti]RXR07356.1 hypothetical protein EPA99_05415 [Pseudoxanthomonas composti]